jgi:hypothetical protein
MVESKKGPVRVGIVDIEVGRGLNLKRFLLTKQELCITDKVVSFVSFCLIQSCTAIKSSSCSGLPPLPRHNRLISVRERPILGPFAILFLSLCLNEKCGLSSSLLPPAQSQPVSKLDHLDEFELSPYSCHLLSLAFDSPNQH